ncbi:MAG: type II secretion system minor pseudopilin GspI [Luminiphilus sp.]|nr:type II secretion system minor pseudopilin GspI [Luminiphilus sp.]
MSEQMHVTRSNMPGKRSLGRLLGFTLVEVMVALAVVAVALPALLIALSQQIDGLRYLEDRTHAQWIAANRLAELRLVLAAKGGVQTRLVSGSEELAGRNWYWWSEGKETPVPGFFHYEIMVSDQEDGRDAPVHTLDGYFAQAPADNAP